jgi:hypothetical protein
MLLNKPPVSMSAFHSPQRALRECHRLASGALLRLCHARSAARQAGCHVGITLKRKVWKQPFRGIVPRYLPSTMADWALDNFVISHSAMCRVVAKEYCASAPPSVTEILHWTNF